ncbi:hypothetical protein VN97_g7822 [Penicillium thymicola]|uniref:Ankyrin repeat domain-containing protein n=1 Tax=Penicillium thymicola TaxID=293382 RepID=A0AAI9TEW2_PENTH|nr:hypothetical protein VN97_g7822 [Penicillium thymicola]
MSNFDLIAFDQIAQLRESILSANMEGIHSTLSQLRDSLDNETFQAKTVPLLRGAVEENSSQLVEYFLENPVDLDSQLVLKATMNVSYQTLGVFLSHGWDINASIDSNTPAALAGIGAPLHYAAGKGSLDSVNLLVQYGASPQTRDPPGQTAADWARRHGHMVVFNFLQDLSASRASEGNLQFTDAPGRQFRTAPPEEVVAKNGFRLV